MEDKKLKELLSKNVAFLQTNDLEKIVKTLHVKNEILLNDNERLWDMLLGLIEILEIDDSIVFELSKGSEINLDKLKDITSIVQTFNIENKFKTLLSLQEDVLKEKLGANVMKALKDGNTEKVWKTKKASELQSRRIKKSKQTTNK